MNQNISNSQLSKKEDYHLPKEFHKDHNVSQLQGKKQFRLPSCEKVKNQHHNSHSNLSSSKKIHQQEQQLLIFEKKQPFTYKKQTQRLVNLLTSICTSSILSSDQQQNVKNVILGFGRQFQSLLDKYLPIFLSFELLREKRQEINKKLILYIDDTLKRQFINIGDTKINSFKESHSNISNLHKYQYSSSKKQKIVEEIQAHQHERHDIHKKSIGIIQSSLNQVNKLLEKAVQPRFVRNSGLAGSRRNRGDSSSIESIMQRSIEQRKKIKQNSQSSKQTLHTINRLLNE